MVIKETNPNGSMLMLTFKEQIVINIAVTWYLQTPLDGVIGNK